MSKKYLFIDTETTGLDPFNNDIIEIGAALFTDIDDSPVLTASFQAKMTARRGGVIELQALQVNNRSLEEVYSDDNSMRDAILRNFAQWLVKYVDKDTLIIGHNIFFDMDFIESAFDNIDIDLDRILSRRQCIDTKQLSMFLNDAYVIETKNNRLVTLTNELFGEKNDENTHQAYADAMDDAAVYFKMRELV